MVALVSDHRTPYFMPSLLWIKTRQFVRAWVRDARLKLHFPLFYVISNTDRLLRQVLQPRPSSSCTYISFYVSRCVLCFLPLDTDVQLLFHQTSRMSNSSLQPISFHSTSSTAFSLLKPSSSLWENKRLTRCETTTMQPAIWQEALMTALFSAMTYFKSCPGSGDVESQGIRGTFPEHKTFYHQINSPCKLLFNQIFYLCNYLPRIK